MNLISSHKLIYCQFFTMFRLQTPRCGVQAAFLPNLLEKFKTSDQTHLALKEFSTAKKVTPTSAKTAAHREA